MTIGVVMLVHDGFDRAGQVARHWAAAGVPVVVHVDKSVARAAYDDFVRSLSDLSQIRFSKRHRCAWGRWSIVAATQDAAQLLLDSFRDVNHVYLTSGACLPIRPIADLRTYLRRHPDTDFIESATTADVPWTVGGLDRERFTLLFPFSWKKQRKLFDLSVRLQRRFGIARRAPDALTPHLGSQWWCLTRKTLTAILSDPRRAEFEAYFRSVWIPDESYFQSLARLHSNKIESRSLTLVKFDFHGKPHILFDDHCDMLRASGCFVARKIWRNAERLYQTFPLPERAATRWQEPCTAEIDRTFAEAVDKRAYGRHGLYMQSRFPHFDRENGVSAASYGVLQGFDDLLPQCRTWIASQTDAEVHGHLYAKDRVQFSDGSAVYRGCQSDSPALRDHDGHLFLTNLIWNSPRKRQVFLYGPEDSQDISWMLAKDTNARIFMISGAWAVKLFQTGRSAHQVRAEAAKLQQREHAFIKALRSPYARAQIAITSLSQFLDAPGETLQQVHQALTVGRAKPVIEMPELVNLDGFDVFLQDLRNQGMHPFLTGDVTIGTSRPAAAQPDRRPYVITKK